MLTSNLGAGSGTSVGLVPGSGPDYERAVLERFRPEFVHRLAALVPFRPLSPDVVREVARKELRQPAEREGLASAGLRLEFTAALVERVAAEGFDARFGARPLQRCLERLVSAPLARFLVARHGLRNPRLVVDVSLSDDLATVRAR